MNVYGVIVAASEVIRFEKGCAILFMLYNAHRDFHFYIFANNNLQLWKRIFVNKYYHFSFLKVGTIEWLSGLQNVILETTLNSTFSEIPDNECLKFSISDDLKNILSVPPLSLKSEMNLFSKLISYQGIITKVRNPYLGIYELDNKVHLYCIFNSLRTSVAAFDDGSKIFISNVHFFMDNKTRKIFVCCGLSSVRLIQEKEISGEKTDSSCYVNLQKYPLSIFDVIWLEALLLQLNLKFCPLLITSDKTFNWESKIVDDIVESFSNAPMGSWSKRQSVGQEFCSSPHSCCVFHEDILPTGCQIQFISNIVDETFYRFSWTKNSDSWETKIIQNKPKDILIGMLYLSKYGCFYIKDKSCDIPIIFTQRCTQCISSESILCKFNDFNLAYLIALQDFEMVFEKIKYISDENNYSKFLRTSCCYLFTLATFYKQKDDTFSFHSVKSSDLCHKSDISFDSLEEVTDMLKNTYLDKEDLRTNAKNFSYFSFNNKDLINNNANQYVLALSKIWTIVDYTFVCYQMLVLLLPQEEVHQEYLDTSKSLFKDDYDNYYETDDDMEFAELVDRIDSIFLEDKIRLARLHFDSAKKCATMLPGHIYLIDFMETFNYDTNCHILLDVNRKKPFLIKIKPSAKIIHYVNCLGYHCLNDYDVDVYCDVKYILSERTVKENSIIRGILFDKLYEECTNSCGSQGEVSKSRTFCLILKDIDSKDTIKVYLRSCPRNLYGFLPGATIFLYGFIYICSKRGYPYLAASSSFAIQLANSMNYQESNDRNMMKPPDVLPRELKLSCLVNMPCNKYFKCLCNVIKIKSAKISLVCNNCSKDHEERCFCSYNYKTKLTVSFLIDDGTSLVFALCHDDVAKKLLMFSENEWKSIVSYVTKKSISLEYSSKTSENVINSYNPENQVFDIYCSSTFLCRQILLICEKKLGSSKMNIPSVWCIDILRICETDLIPELLIEVKNIDTQVR